MNLIGILFLPSYSNLKVQRKNMESHKEICFGSKNGERNTECGRFLMEYSWNVSLLRVKKKLISKFEI